MWLRLKCAKLDKEPKIPEVDPFDLQYYNGTLRAILYCHISLTGYIDAALIPNMLQF